MVDLVETDQDLRSGISRSSVGRDRRLQRPHGPAQQPSYWRPGWCPGGNAVYAVRQPGCNQPVWSCTSEETLELRFVRKCQLEQLAAEWANYSVRRSWERSV